MSAVTDHETEFLRPDDPHFPCTVIEEQYVPSCYGYQPTHMYAVFNGDDRAVIRECLSLEEELHRSCFGSFGANVASRHREQLATAVQICGFIPDDAAYAVCISGLVSERFGQAEDIEHGVAICNLVEERSGYNECWWRVIDRAGSLFADRSDREAVCARFPEGRQQQYCHEQLLCCREALGRESVRLLQHRAMT